MTDSARVLIYVQHLLGIGHLKRTALIAKALSEVDAEQVLHIDKDTGAVGHGCSL